MKLTFILSNKTDYFFEKLANIPTQSVLFFMNDNGINPKIGNDTIKEQVEFNTLLKTGGKFSEYTLENRKGYKLLTTYLS